MEPDKRSGELPCSVTVAKKGPTSLPGRQVGCGWTVWVVVEVTVTLLEKVTVLVTKTTSVWVAMVTVAPRVTS
jgi:hypothetical protein